MRYLVLATHVPADGRGGGIVRYTRELVAGLARVPGVDLGVLVRRGAEEVFAADVPSERVWSLRGTSTIGRSTREVLGAFGALHDFDHDVVHGTKHFVPLVRTRRGRPPLSVLTLHDMTPFERPQDFNPSKRLLVRAPLAGALRRSDLVLAVSSATAERAAAFDRRLTGKTVTVPLAVSSAMVAAEPVPVESLRGARFALTVGDASPRKNIAALMDIWQQVVARDPGAKLVHVGPSGWGTNDYGPLYEPLVARGAVVPLGHVPDGELRWLYETARACLCPSKHEGFGLPTAEAAYFGTPIVRSTDAAQREAAGGSGMEIDTADTAAWAAAVTSLLSTAGRPGAGAYDLRSWDDVAAETVVAVRSSMGPGTTEVAA